MSLTRQAGGSADRVRVLQLMIATCLAGALTPGSLSAQAVLRGRVVTEEGLPVANATVTLTALRYAVRTDSLGGFVLSGTPGGKLDLSLDAVGYRTEAVSVVLARRGAVSRDFVLSPDGTPRPELETADRFLRGIVTDEQGNPLPYANVQLNGGRRFIANDSGRFAIPVGRDGRVTLLSRRIGFEAAQLQVEAATDTAITIVLRSVAQILPGQTVEGRQEVRSLKLYGFYERLEDAQKGLNFGYYITPEELEIRRPVNATDALEHLPNIRIVAGNHEYVIQYTPTGPRQVNLSVPRNMIITDRSGCVLTVYLDGIRIHPSVRSIGNGYRGDTQFKQDMQDEQINSLISPGALAGVEVYTRGLTAPAQYQPMASTCGIVLFWTK
jgi:hypothetical protein